MAWAMAKRGFVSRSTTLQERDAANLLAVGRTRDLAALLDHLLQLDVPHDVFEVGVGQVAPVLRLPSGRLDDGAGAEGVQDLAVAGGAQRHVEQSGGPRDLGGTRRCVHLDPIVRADRVDQGFDSRLLEIVIGRLRRDRPVLLRQPATQLGGLFDEPDVVPCAGRLQRRGQARDPAADHQEGLVDGLLGPERLQQLHLLDLRDVHAEVVLRHHLRVLVVRRLAPHHVVHQGQLLDDHALREGVLPVTAGRDPGDDDLGQLLLLDGLDHGGEIRPLAGVHRRAEGHLALARDHLGQRVDVERGPGSVPRADEHASLVSHRLTPPPRCSELP